MNKVTLQLSCDFFKSRKILCPCGCNKGAKTLYRDLDHFVWFAVGMSEIGQALDQPPIGVYGNSYAALELAVKGPRDKYLFIRQGDDESDREIAFVDANRLAPEHFDR